MPPLSKAKLKLYRSLRQKKFRQVHQLFLVEGKKMLQEALTSGWKVADVIMLEGLQDALPEDFPLDMVQLTDARTFSELSGQVSPEGVLAVLEYPSSRHYQRVSLATDMAKIDGLALLLEDIQDPGNLGTLLRTADWLGFSAVVCSRKTVDCFNPKVLRSSMGAIFRVPLIYLQEFPEWVLQVQEQVWLADMAGHSPAETDVAARPDLLLGNEANGVSSQVREIPGIQSLTIPRSGGGESLNVAISGAILAWEMRKAQS